MAGYSILFVDDNEMMHDVLAQLLHFENFEVTSAYTGRQAMEMIEQGRNFDLILLDLGLPDCNGAELAARMSAEIPEGAPILLSSGDPKVHGLELSGRVVGTVTKPYDFSKFIPLLRQSISSPAQRS